MNCARPDLWEAGSGNWPVDPTYRTDRPLLAESSHSRPAVTAQSEANFPTFHATRLAANAWRGSLDGARSFHQR